MSFHDSMPRTVLEQWAKETECLPEIQRDMERQRRIAAYLNAGHGACWLRDGRIAEVVEDTLLQTEIAAFVRLDGRVWPDPNHADGALDSGLWVPLGIYGVETIAVPAPAR